MASEGRRGEMRKWCVCVLGAGGLLLTATGLECEISYGVSKWSPVHDH